MDKQRRRWSEELKPLSGGLYEKQLLGGDDGGFITSFSDNLAKKLVHISR